MGDLEAREDAIGQGVRAPDPYPALLRAAQRAREVARQTNTPLVIYQDGRIVHLDVSRRAEEGLASES